MVIRQKEKEGKDIGSLYLNSLINIGVSYKNERRFEEAVDVYQKVNVLAPEDESGLFNHAVCLLGLIEITPEMELVNRHRASTIEVLLNRVE